MAAWAVVPLESLSRVVVFEASAIGIGIPGDFPVRAHVFTWDGGWLSKEDFSGGWRTDWVSARAVCPKNVGLEVIEVSACGSMDNNTVPLSKQYFALRKDHVVLVRLEDRAGKAIPNEYGAPNWTIGPIPKFPRDEDWQGTLLSDDLTDRLAALVWLGGTHVDPGFPPGTEVYHEDRTLGAFCEDLRRRPGISARLRVLADSPNLWECEAARLALSPKRHQHP
jgi:hypothetical protein